MTASGASRWLSWASSTIVATAVAVLSASKLIKLARAAGWSGPIAPLLFLAIDGAGVAGGLTAFYGASRAARNYGWFVLCESTTLSLLGNEAADWVQVHGYLPGWMTAVVAAAVPLQLPLTVHQTVLLSHRDEPSTVADRPHANGSAPTDPIGARTPDPFAPAARGNESIGSGRHSVDRMPLTQMSTSLPIVGHTTAAPAAQPTDSRSIDSLDPIDRQPDQGIPSSGDQTDAPSTAEPTRSIRSTPVRSIEDLRVELVRAIESGAIDSRPTAEAIRKHLSISPARARLLRDEFADHGPRPEFHVVPSDPDDQATG